MAAIVAGDFAQGVDALPRDAHGLGRVVADVDTTGVLACDAPTLAPADNVVDNVIFGVEVPEESGDVLFVAGGEDAAVEGCLLLVLWVSVRE